MNQSSSAITGGVTLTAASLTPVVTWALNGFQTPVPESVPYLIAAGLVTGAHLAYNVITRRANMQQTTKEPS